MVLFLHLLQLVTQEWQTHPMPWLSVTSAIKSILLPVEGPKPSSLFVQPLLLQEDPPPSGDRGFEQQDQAKTAGVTRTLLLVYGARPFGFVYSSTHSCFKKGHLCQGFVALRSRPGDHHHCQGFVALRSRPGDHHLCPNVAGRYTPSVALRRRPF